MFFDLKLFLIGCLRIVTSYVNIGLVIFPIWRLPGGDHADPPRINDFQKVQTKSHEVKIRSLKHSAFHKIL